MELSGKAMSATMHEMADQIAKAADPRAWTQEHPWYSVGRGRDHRFHGRFRPDSRSWRLSYKKTE